MLPLHVKTDEVTRKRKSSADCFDFHVPRTEKSTGLYYLRLTVPVEASKRSNAMQKAGRTFFQLKLRSGGPYELINTNWVRMPKLRNIDSSISKWRGIKTDTFRSFFFITKSWKVNAQSWIFDSLVTDIYLFNEKCQFCVSYNRPCP